MIESIAELINSGGMNVEHLDLHGRILSLDDVKVLSTELKNNHLTNKIDLSYSGLGDKEVLLLAGALAENKHVTWIDMSHNKIGDAGVVALSNTELKWLDLCGNKNIGKPGMEALGSNTTLLFVRVDFELRGIYNLDRTQRRNLWNLQKEVVTSLIILAQSRFQTENFLGQLPKDIFDAIVLYSAGDLIEYLHKNIPEDKKVSIVTRCTRWLENSLEMRNKHTRTKRMSAASLYKTMKFFLPITAEECQEKLPDEPQEQKKTCCIS